MVPDFPGRTPLLVAIALLPGAVRWLSGRALIRRPNDPAMPERMLALARQSGAMAALAAAALLLIAPRAALWTLPLLLVARLVAAYPLRRALLGERWTLPRYLSFFLRLIVAVYGLWIALLALPLVVASAGRWDWLAAALLAAALIVWSSRTADVVRAMFRSKPLLDAARLERFSAMAVAAGLPAPRFEVVTLGGGTFANAVALPSARPPSSVLFTETLLTELSEGEADAICAHELAHLEYYTPQRIGRMHLVTAGLIISGAAIGPITRTAGSGVVPWLAGAWYVALVGVAVWRARHRQRHETDSDLRAVALSGDAEALVRALTRLYALGRVPRRLDLQLERQATHPSLARRIRDIRRAGGVQPARLEERTSFAAPARGTIVTFEPTHVQWQEGEAATHTLSYAHLSEVRIAARQAGPATLVVVERGGRRWTMPLEPADVARAQSVLDVVDGHLGEAPLPRVWPRVVRIAMLFVSLFALLIGQFAAMLLALSVLARPSPTLVAAAGGGALTASAIALRDFGAGGRLTAAALALGAAGFGLLAAARAWKRDGDESAKPVALLALAVCALGAWVSLLFGGLDAVGVHRSARAISAATVLPVALGAALIWSSRRLRQLAGVGAIVMGALPALTASTWFLDQFGRDPLLVPMKPASVVFLERTPVAEISLPFYASAVRFSPGGGRLLVTEDAETDGEERPIFHVASPGSALTPLEADDVAFIDDEHVLLLTRAREGLEVREIAVASPDIVLWRQRVPILAGARLSFDVADQTWRVLGWNRASEVVRHQGRRGLTRTTETRWRRRATPSGYINAVVVSDDRALFIESRYDFGFQSAALRFWSVLPFTLPEVESRYWALGPDGEEHEYASRFGAQCLPTTFRDDRVVCAVFDGTRTRIVTIDSSGRVAPARSFAGRFVERAAAGDGWITGWWGSTPLALRLSTGDAVAIRGNRGDWIADVKADGRTAAALGYSDGGSVVRIIPLER